MTDKIPRGTQSPAASAGLSENDDALKEVCVASATVHRGKFLTLKQDIVRLPDGKQTGREYVVHPGAVMMIPLFDDGTVLLERQFRYPVGEVMLEFPAGKLDPEEGAQRCGERELLEETGYRAARWDYLTRIHPVISYSTEFIDILLARDLTHGEAQLDDGEFLETFIAPAGQVIDWVRSGRITDVKTIIGAFWLEKVISGAWQPGEQPMPAYGAAHG
ncbi:putative ADP-ribose diphosphatase [Cupriavidus taiwanensis]|uniref:GDP-mannose pyrophosphatase n=1 Tax=Cupriavidus taiwanensis TaxID=164546 RepID=A0A976ATK2_9BURK|nr:NUDIX hydrolase [Cupriavidus taiwanensis]SOZ15704.1 putative ADP-ribose diphosphatase [Cupriavidus taiwanensis]SOZ28815.1 putative ADP-ribose diphosphatase [Cupriavidus taiwanensis]SOZ46276.1 putative ADP-ribose diphosphatase [Cupriavidus taiwanensis]SOZ49469.1 putative ADP-ribose diphosphatase [Cupriavidus taiwanensis]SOZ49964.1 putative ADP-ribose diphosphatase [Cupriavidus taiwanensis]